MIWFRLKEILLKTLSVLVGLALTCRVAITKLDILDTFEEVKIGVAYYVDGEKIEDSFPGK